MRSVTRVCSLMADSRALRNARTHKFFFLPSNLHTHTQVENAAIPVAYMCTGRTHASVLTYTGLNFDLAMFSELVSLHTHTHKHARTPPPSVLSKYTRSASSRPGFSIQTKCLRKEI